MVTAEPGYIVHAKITAAEIRDACPPQLVDYGERIADDLAAAALYEADAAKYTDKAERHRVSAGHYLSLAAEACDEGGFVAFRARFCPDLGKSRANELRQIAAGKKSPEEIRAKTRDRVARHRARRAPTATNGAGAPAASVTANVTDAPPPTSPKKSAEEAPARLNGTVHVNGSTKTTPVEAEPSSVVAHVSTGIPDDPFHLKRFAIALASENEELKATIAELRAAAAAAAPPVPTVEVSSSSILDLPKQRSVALARLLEAVEVGDFLAVAPPHLRRGLEKRALDQRGLKRSDQITRVLHRALTSRSPAEQITALAKANELLAADGFSATDLCARVPKARK